MSNPLDSTLAIRPSENQSSGHRAGGRWAALKLDSSPGVGGKRREAPSQRLAGIGSSRTPAIFDPEHLDVALAWVPG